MNWKRDRIESIIRFFVLLALCISASGYSVCFAQSGGLAGGYAGAQIGHCVLNQRYGYDVYNYIFDVRNGIVSWNYSGPNGKDQGRFACNKQVEGDIITAECTGLVHWQFAGKFLWELVEEIGDINNIRYKWAMEALESAVSCFEKAKKSSPEAYDRVIDTYNTIKKAEKGRGKESLWDVLALYSYALSEHELTVEDLYDYNF